MPPQISVSLDGTVLEINPVSGAAAPFQDMEDAYTRLRGHLNTGKVTGARINLLSADPGNHAAISFIIACGSILANHKIQFEFINIADGQMEPILRKTGFDLKGSFSHTDLRPSPAPEPLFNTIGRGIFKLLDDLKKIIGFMGDTFLALVHLLRHPSKFNLQEVLFYMDRSGADAVPIVLVICFLVGAILAFQGVQQMGRFGLEIYVADLVALSIVRELGPLMVGMICIGRAGSAYAAELGTMKVSEEIDALKTMGIKPERIIVIPKITALVFAMPMLVILGDIAGIIGGVVVGTTLSKAGFQEYVHRTVESLVPANVLETMIKGFAFAFIIAAVGCFRGFEAENDAKGVGNATTSAVVSGIFLVVVMDFFITFTYPNFIRLFGVAY